ncbi:hypothetical protein A7982_12511 [Minicystis rosea]|nr:hypothetical protein A7982_12511 [Minicystis rosea]
MSDDRNHDGATSGPEPSEAGLHRDAPDRDEAHPKAREALTDDFFWNAGDPTGPFGNETALEVYEALRDLRDDDPRASALALLDALLEGWEVKNEGWDAVDEADVHALGADDELGLLVRDEAILSLCFGDLILTGRVDPEVRRRAILALSRQALPALLHGFGDQMKVREARVARMRELLSRKWD